MGPIWQNNFTNSSQKGLLICASKLQVHCRFYKLDLQVRFIVNLQVKLSVLICVLSV